jgi:Fic family protein
MFVKSESALTIKPPMKASLLASFDLIAGQASIDGATLTAGMIFDWQTALLIEGGFRTKQVEPQVSGHAPAQPNALPTLLSTTLEWFGAESFLELHPIEQAALVHARFLDVQFFPSENTRLARFAANFYLTKAELPPLMIADVNQYKAALHQAILMNTQALINIYAESTERVLSELLSEVNKHANS